ncbi:toxin Cry1Ac domain D-VI-related protein, partial [Listeria newyorkensis]
MKNASKKIAVGLLTTTIVASQIFPTSLSLSESLSGGHLAEATVATDYFSAISSQSSNIIVNEANGKINVVVNLTKLSTGGTIRIRATSNGVGAELYNYGILETPTATGIKIYTLDKKVEIPKFGMLTVDYYNKAGTAVVASVSYLVNDGFTSTSQDISDATNKVNNLFKDANKNSLKPTTDQAAIDAAQAAVDKLAAGTDKTNLQNDINKAKELLAKQTADKAAQNTAKTAVDALFTDATKTGIKLTTDQAAIDAAQALVNKVQDPTVKADLQKDIDKAQSLLDGQNEQAKQNTANTAVKELFTNNDPASNAIKDTTNQKAIDDAQKTIDVLAAGPVKTALQADLDKAQDLLDARTQQAADDQNQKAVATYAVNQLFVNNTPISDAIKASTDQDAIDSAQAEINKIKDPALKADLQKDLDRAQELLNQRNAANQAEQAKQDAARKAVNELFNSNTPASNAIKPTTTQATIDAAQRLIDTVTDPTTKAALQADLNKAQSLLDAKNAAAATEKAKQDAAKKAVDE